MWTLGQSTMITRVKLQIKVLFFAGNMGDNCSCPGKRDELLLAQAATQNTVVRLLKSGPDQMNILENELIKEKALSLCRETDELDTAGDDAGYIRFMAKYISLKLIKTLFVKQRIEYIGSAKELAALLRITIMLYKAKVHKIKNLVFNSKTEGKTPFSKSDIKWLARYLSEWIIKHCLENDGEVCITSEQFQKNMCTYLQQFVTAEWKKPLPYDSALLKNM